MIHEGARLSAALRLECTGRSSALHGTGTATEQALDHSSTANEAAHSEHSGLTLKPGLHSCLLLLLS